MDCFVDLLLAQGTWHHVIADLLHDGLDGIKGPHTSDADVAIPDRFVIVVVPGGKKKTLGCIAMMRWVNCWPFQAANLQEISTHRGGGRQSYPTTHRCRWVYICRSLGNPRSVARWGMALVSAPDQISF